jgi:hypothetical protein
MPLRRIGEVELQFHAFLTSALDGGEWSASRPSRFIPRERAPGTHWIESVWTRWWREKFPAPDYPALSPEMYHWVGNYKYFIQPWKLHKKCRRLGYFLIIPATIPAGCSRRGSRTFPQNSTTTTKSCDMTSFRKEIYFRTCFWVLHSHSTAKLFSCFITKFKHPLKGTYSWGGFRT